METGVYVIANMHTGQLYYGSSTSSFIHRCSQHITDLRRGVHGNSKLQRSWKKYGEDAFIFSRVEECSPEQALVKEQLYFDTEVNWEIDFNICRIAGNTLGVKRSEETKEKLRILNTGKKQSLETVEKRVLQLRGRKQSPEQIEAARLPRIGKRRSEEIKQKMSESQKNRNPISDETRRKMSESHKGKSLPKSEEHKKKLSEAKKIYYETHVSYLKGRKLSEETKLKLSEIKQGKPAHNKGKPMSEEQKRKISESKKAKFKERRSINE